MPEAGNDVGIILQRVSLKRTGWIDNQFAVIIQLFTGVFLILLAIVLVVICDDALDAGRSLRMSPP